jgi:uncharacterized RDD family membrane protein YckC
MGLYLAYLATAESLTGFTLGKYLMGLQVVTDKGDKPDFWAAMIRNVIGYFERHPLVALLAAGLYFCTPRRQRLGDLLARTLVVQTAALDLYMDQKEEEWDRKFREKEELERQEKASKKGKE